MRLRLKQRASLQEAEESPEESTGALRRALKTLSADDRDLLMMRAWDELSIRGHGGHPRLQ